MALVQHQSGSWVYVLFVSVASLAPNSGLLGTNIQETALVDQWISFVDLEVDVHRRVIQDLLRGLVPYFKPVCPPLHCAVSIFHYS